MPKLPLPPAAPIGGGDLPVTDASDVAVQEADFVRKPTTATIRDALREAAKAMMLRYQQLAETAAAQASRRRATGIYLKGAGAERSIFQQRDEGQDPYRARILGRETPVTPDAICAAANAVLAPYTTIPCRYFESVLDRGYINDGTDGGGPGSNATWHAYVGCSTGAVSPTYPDRLYPDDLAVNGASIPNRDPGTFWIFGDNTGHYFVLRVPVLAGMEDPNNFVFQNHPTLDPDGCFWIQTSAGTGEVASFVTVGGAALDIYQALANTVDRLVGHSIRWMLYADPNLTA